MLVSAGGLGAASQRESKGANMLGNSSKQMAGLWVRLRRMSPAFLFGLLLGFAQPGAAATRQASVAPASGLDTRPDNTTCIAPQRPPQTSAVVLQSTIRTSFEPPAVVPAVNDLSVWYMVDRAGAVNRYRRSGKTFSFLNKFADTKDRSLNAFQGVPYGEMGLLGMAMHPKFSSNGFVFLYYSAAGTQGTAVEARLSRFVSRDGGVNLDMSSEEVLLRVPRISQYHWGGTLNFGPDGLLYVAFGEGGQPSKSQALDSYLGKMIRINVDAAPGYKVPVDNPFVGKAGALPEIYAYGFRNPWKWSFDRLTGAIWLGDVGSSTWEEVNQVVKGGNYGWPLREGAHCSPSTPACSPAGLIDPVVEYARSPGAPGAAVIGGFVYTGTAMPGLVGVYVYADAYGKVWALRYDKQGRPAPELLVETIPIVGTFAQDEVGELYLATAGYLYLLAPAGTAEASNFPQKLSQTGCMSAANPALPGPAMIPYDVNAPLWSDGAAKERWFAIPNGSTIRRLDDGDWDLPIGAVTVKAFRLNGRLVETRLMVRHDDGEWAGYTYEWNDAQTDALLLPAGKTKTVEGQQWTYPSRNQCLGCHTSVAGRTLGLETAQLNRSKLYPTTNRMANQLATLDAIGMFSAPLNASPDDLAKLAEPFANTSPLDVRARSYLHGNCSMCHRPNGPGQGPEDFRFSTPGVSMGAVNVLPTQSSFGIPDARLLSPGHPEKSIISYRLQTLALGRMPPLGSAMVDTAGVALVNQWIRSGLGMGVGDRDGDGFADNVDNCKNTANATQLDSDGDGIGNQCDADFNNDGRVNSLDLAVIQQAFGAKQGDAKFNANADMNGDGRINAIDLGLFQARFGKPVGDQ